MYHFYPVSLIFKVNGMSFSAHIFMIYPMCEWVDSWSVQAQFNANGLSPVSEYAKYCSFLGNAHFKISNPPIHSF